MLGKFEVNQSYFSSRVAGKLLVFKQENEGNMAVVYILQVFRKGEDGNNNGTFSWIWGRILGIGTKRPENA